jgi:hypothetical protein
MLPSCKPEARHASQGAGSFSSIAAIFPLEMDRKAASFGDPDIEHLLNMDSVVQAK